jgi:hypothetical protein
MLALALEDKAYSYPLERHIISVESRELVT